jgi:hypothetical protein
MNRGFWAGDAIAQSLESSIKAQSDLAQTERILENLKRLERDLEKTTMDNAANLAEKYALREALSRLDPRHPLLTNQALRERIHMAGEQAMAISRNYNDARDVGKTFKY